MTVTSEQRREWGRLGGLKRAQQFTPEYQAAAGKRSAEVNDMAALGHKGAQAFIAKYGYGKLYHLCREWRLRHPSAHEQHVMDILCTLRLEPGRDYDREFEIEPFLSVDFAIPLLRKAIEVNGKVHYDPVFDDPRRLETRAANDAAKMARLGTLGWAVLVLDYRQSYRFDQLVKAFLAGG
jgi:very-short-patch-repair endonuclease